MNRYVFTFTITLIWSAAGTVAAMSAEQLRILLEEPGSNRVVVIDIRNRAKFQSGHVVGSLRIPAVGIEGRNVPPFGRVVVIWDGIDRDEASRVLRALNAKPGIDAELLDGGYPSWSASGAITSGTAGLGLSVMSSVTYDELLKLADNPNLVVVDLRDGTDDDLTDLSALLPNARIVAPLADERRDMKLSLESAEGLDRQGVRKRSVPRWLRGQSLDDSRGLFVLVDSGDGRLAERVYLRLAGSGQKRVLLLMGGERSLQSRGEPELVTRSKVYQDE